MEQWHAFQLALRVQLALLRVEPARAVGPGRAILHDSLPVNLVHSHWWAHLCVALCPAEHAQVEQAVRQRQRNRLSGYGR